MTVLAQAKAGLALVLVLVEAVPVAGVEWLRFFLIAAFLTPSLLLSSSRKDAAKCHALAGVMALLAARLSLRLLSGWDGVYVWMGVYPEAFIGAAALAMATSFPGTRVHPALLNAAIAWGVLDSAMRLVLAGTVFRSPSPSHALLGALPGWEWIPTYLPALISVLYLVPALALSEGAELRQLKVFLYGLVVGVAPFALVLPGAALVPAFNEWLASPGIQPYFLAFTYPVLAVFPITATYTVMYQGVLDYQSALRRAAQYALARYTLLWLIALPLAAGVVLLYVNREEPLGRLLTGWRFLALAAVAAGSATAFPLRHRLLAALDRRYFREAYDARHVLRRLTESVRKTRDIGDLSRLLVEQVDKALHVESVVLMAVNPEQSGVLKTAAAIGVPEPDPIPVSAQFVSLLAGSSDPLPVDVEAPGSLIGRLPEKEKEWLRASGASLLVPLLGSGEMLTGFLAVGRRKSEMPFSEEDHDLLASVGGAAGTSLETRLLRATPSPGGGAESASPERPTARECLSCLRLLESSALLCDACQTPTQPALLPLILLDKYRLESRLGSGGFGVVYAATELRLGRRVALKTMPGLSPEKVERFKREALAAASIQHPNLAMIHTAESWSETPILVFELLEAGTLASRLLRGPLSVADTLVVGRGMAGVLEAAHLRGILHRDIKPSNIGYDARQTPKLLDFGIARIRDPAASPIWSGDAETISRARLERGEVPIAPTLEAALTETGVIVGTPAYLPPEAYEGRQPGPAFDLWALSVTLYESLAAVNPFRGATLAETVGRVMHCVPPPLVEVRPDCPPVLSSLLERALSQRENARPGSATEFAEALREVR